jgi:YD repeat-containing protein
MVQICRVSLTTGALALICATANAQTPFRHSGSDPRHGSYTPVANEHIDPASGTLTLVATDLVLPGNAGLDLRVTRVYSSHLFPQYDSGSTALDEDSWAGIGWRLHFGRVLNPTATTGGTTLIEFGDGSRQPLYTTTAYPEGWMTAGFARYDRATHTLKLPNGQVYTFGHQANLGTLGLVRYVTEIRDPFNNKIEFSYFAAPGPLDGVKEIRQYLSAAQVRVVTFTYDSTLKALATMRYDGKTWTYTHTAKGAAGHSLLRTARPPVGKDEEYDYAALPGELTRYETPAGGVTTYTYQDATRKAATLTNRTRVVTKRVTSGRLVTGGTWTFSYGTGSNQDTTVVACPCGTSTYRFNGMGLSGDFSAWKAGTLAEQTVAEPGGAVLERRTFSWVRSTAISPNPVPGESGVWSDPAVYAALLDAATIARGTQSWTTSYEYTGGSFNNFGHPSKVTDTGDFLRWTTIAYQTGFAPHLLGRVASTWTRLGPEGIGSTSEYDLATGFVTFANGPRTPGRHFVAHPDGNLASEKDALDHDVFYESYTWGLPQTIRTETTTTTLTVKDQGLIGSVTGPLTTTYTYDALFRPLTTSSPGVTVVSTTYDDAGGTGWRTSRGTAFTGVVVDGFGRPVLQYSSSGVKTHTAYDACGRAVSGSLPYTSGLPDAIGTPGPGMATVYDALGRIKTVTGPDGAVSQYAYAGIDVTVTDAEGRSTVYNYQAAGSPDAARLGSVTDAATVTTTYTYDVIDMLVRVSGPGPVPDRTWAHDGLMYISDTQPESGTTTYAHNAAGNVITTTDAKGQIITFAYDADDRLQRVDPPGTADDVTLTYDTHGRLVSQATATTGITYGYNVAGQLASRGDTVGAATFTSLYEYDANENLTKITYPSGRAVTYTYDTHDRLTTVRQNGNVFADQFTYDSAGRLASYRTGPVTHTVGYDTAGRTKTLTSGSALNLTYGYDLVGNVRTMTEPAQPTQQFGYDPLYRLETAAGPWGQRSWQYTPSGDRLMESGAGSTFYQYDAATRRLMATSGARTEAFTYNPVGEMTADGRGTYQYNASGLVTQFTGLNVNAAYTYDPSGLRVARAVNGVTTYTVRSSGGTVLSEYRAACGAPVWTRDVIYAGSRLLGSVKATNTEPFVGLSQGAVSVSEGTSTQNATIVLTTFGGGPLQCPLTVTYNAVPGTAGAGTDYALAAGSVTFNPGEVSGATRTVPIQILADTIDEHDETFSATLSSAVGAQVTGTVTQVVTILDDDALPGLSIQDGAMIETNSGTAALPLTVTLNAPSGKTIAVAYGTANGTAVAPGDYTGYSWQVAVFAPGVTSQTVYVMVAGDLVRELDETLTVTLSAPSHATITRATATATIVDNDRPVSPRKSDFNGDGKPDFLWRHDTTGALAVWLMDGPTMTTVAAPTPSQSPPGHEVVGTADFYADGSADIVWRNTTTGDVSIWVMSGLMQLRTETMTPQMGDPNWRAVAVADINGDNHPDLLWHHTEGWVAVSMLVGRTVVALHLLSSTPVPAGWRLAATGDLDQDGHTDLVWHSSTNGDLVWWRLDGNVFVSSAPLSPGSMPNLQWQVRGGADIDRDGMTDLLWQNTVTGEIAVWFMNGAAIRYSSLTSPGQLADLAWHLVGPK